MEIELLERNAERAAGLLSAMANPRRLMVLCKLIDGEKSVTALADAVGLSQSALSQHLAKLREKNLADSSVLAEAREISALCKQYRVPFILNDNVALAAQCGADGVHLGQEDMDPAEARRILGPDAIIGVSAHNVAEAKAAVAAGADYLGCGAMFATTTKTNVTALPKETLRAICAAVPVPVVAIGGISKQNLLSLAHCGEAGVALVSAIFAAEDIEEECRELRRLAAQL